MKASVLFAVMLVAAPAAAVAQDEGVQGRWSLAFTGGAAFPTGGEFHEGGRGTVLGLPTSAWASKPASGIRPICRRSKAWQVPASKI